MYVASAVTADMLRVRYLRVQESIADVNNVLQENISGVRVVQGLRPGRRAAPARSTPRTRATCAANLSTAGGAGRGHPGHPDDLRLRAWPWCWWSARWQILNGVITVGTLVAFVSYLIQFYQPVEDLIRVNNTIQQALAAAERIFEFLDEAPDVADRPGPSTSARPRARARSVAFEDVTFAYEPGKPVLHEISLRGPRRGRSWPWSATPARARRPSST